METKLFTVSCRLLNSYSFIELSDAPPMDHVDWRAQLPLDSRRRIVNKILETLKQHLPHSAELENIAVRFEGDVYSAATSQNDYLRKISLKMLTLETQSQSAMANSPQTVAANASQNPSDLGSSGQCQQNSSSVGLMNDNNWWGSRVPMVQPQAGTVEHSAIPSSASASPMVLDDWRGQIPLESRQRITNNILETLKKRLPYSGQEGLQELLKIAIRFEEKIYSAATSQSDYLSKISLKMLLMETKSQSPMANSLQTVAAKLSHLDINI